MTDFLIRLAQRTLGLAPVVQPRIASRYAPAVEVMMANDYDLSISSNVEPASKSSTAPEQFATTQPSTEALNVPISQPPSLAAPELPLAQSQETIPSASPFTTPFANPEQNSPLVTPQTSDQTTPDLSLDSENNASVAQTETSVPNIHPSQPLKSAEPELPLAQSQETISSPSPFTTPFSNPEQNSPLVTPQTSDQTTLNSSLDAENNASVAQTKTSFTNFLDAPRNTSENLLSSSHPPFSSPFSPQSLKQSELKQQVSSVRLPLVPPTTINSSNSSSPPLVNAQEVSIEVPSVNQQNRISPELTSTKSSPGRSSSASAQAIKQPEPIVEVRIGRIEVRGIQPTTSKSRPKSTPSTPALSLSDYLNQRDGGKK